MKKKVHKQVMKALLQLCAWMAFLFLCPFVGFAGQNDWGAITSCQDLSAGGGEEEQPEQGDPADTTLKSLFYRIEGGEAKEVPGFTPETHYYQVTYAPEEKGSTLYAIGETNNPNAKIESQQEGKAGSEYAVISISSEDGSEMNGYYIFAVEQ